jgi:hypothetical protein
MWRRDWAAGRVRAGDGPKAAMAWVGVVVVGAFSVPLLYKLPEMLAKKGQLFVAVGLMFPVATLGLLAWAVLATLRWWRFRGIVLALDTQPGVVGGHLRGTVHVPTGLELERGFRVRLSCVRRRWRRSTGGKRELDEDVVWQDQRDVDPTSAFTGPTGAALPIAFRVPFEAPPSSPEPGPDVHVWRLEVSAATRGPDLASVFEVPVFRTKASSREVTDTLPVDGPPKLEPAQGALDPAGLLTLEDSCITAALHPTGELELTFPARRNRGFALVLSLFALFWNGVVVFAGREMSFPSSLFLVPFAAVGLLLLGLALAVSLHSLRVRVRSHEVEVEHRLPGWRWAQSVPSDQLAGVTPEVRGHTNGRAEWGIRLQRRGGKPLRAGDGLRSRRDAVRIASAIREVVRSGRGECRL